MWIDGDTRQTEHLWAVEVVWAWERDDSLLLNLSFVFRVKGPDTYFNGHVGTARRRKSSNRLGLNGRAAY